MQNKRRIMETVMRKRPLRESTRKKSLLESWRDEEYTYGDSFGQLSTCDGDDCYFSTEEYAKPLTRSDLLTAKKNNETLWYYPDGVYGGDEPFEVKIAGNIIGGQIPLVAIHSNTDDPNTFTIMDYTNLSREHKFTPIDYDSMTESVNENGAKEIRRYSDVVPYEDRKYWYFTTHGVGPGSIPKGVNVLDVQDGRNEKGTWGEFVLLDAVLNTSELKEYGLKELAPKDGMPMDEDFDYTEKLHEDFDSDENTVDDDLKANGMANEVIVLINDEWDTVKAYQNALVNVDAYDVPNADGIKKVFNDIIEEENKHIGQLQAIMDELNNASADIQSGIEEGKEQLGTEVPTEEKVEEKEVEFVGDDDIDEDDEAFFGELLSDKVEEKDEDDED